MKSYRRQAAHLQLLFADSCHVQQNIRNDGERNCLINLLKEKCYAHIHKFNLVYYRKRLNCSNVQKTHHVPYTVHCCSSSFQPLSETLYHGLWAFQLLREQKTFNTSEEWEKMKIYVSFKRPIVCFSPSRNLWPALLNCSSCYHK